MVIRFQITSSLTLREQVKPARSWSPALIPGDDGDGIHAGLLRQNLPNSGPVRKVSSTGGVAQVTHNYQYVLIN